MKRQEDINDNDNGNDKEVSCEEKIMSNDYYDIIYQYLLEQLLEPVDITTISDECMQVISPLFASFHIDRQGKDCSEIYKGLSVLDIPVLMALYGKRAMSAASISQVSSLPGLQLRGANTLIGVIDTGIDYTHEAFIYEDNTSKISYLWDQTRPGNNPEGFGFGYEYTNEDINDALDSEDPYSIVQEVDEIGHGTYMAGVAAGRENKSEQFIGAAPDADLIIVKLKPAKQCLRDFYLINDKAIAYQSNDIVVGIKYCVEKALELRKPLSLVIGSGTNYSDHSGGIRLAEQIEFFANLSGVTATVPAGNEANTASHYRGKFVGEEKTIDVQFNVAERERGFIMIFVKYPPDELELEIISPTGVSTGKLKYVGESKEEIVFGAEETQLLFEFSTFPVTGNRVFIIRMENPSPGIWTIRVYGTFVLNGFFDIYLPSQEFRQKDTKFLEPNPDFTVTSPGNDIGLITVGAYDDITNTIYIPSGRGPTTTGDVKPDFVAPGVNVKGPLPGNRYGLMSGTSVSASITAGACALLLEWGVVKKNFTAMNTLIANTLLIRGASRDGNIKYPNNEFGYGKLNLANTFKQLES